MTNTINMAAYARMLSGLDPMLHQLETLVEPQSGNNFPLSNIEKIGDDRSRLTLCADDPQCMIKGFLGP